MHALRKPRWIIVPIPLRSNYSQSLRRAEDHISLLLLAPPDPLTFGGEYGVSSPVRLSESFDLGSVSELIPRTMDGEPVGP